MIRIIDALRVHAAKMPQRTAIEDGHVTLSYRDLLCQVEHVANQLREASPRALAILADNGVSWAIADLAACRLGIPLIPLPLFFSAAQIAHVISTAGIDQILTDRPDQLFAALRERTRALEPFTGTLQLVRLPVRNSVALPPGTRKITFTSGTTGEPKGVCLGYEEMETVAESLRVASAANSDDRHLCLLPMATLLENIAGLYTPLLAGATTCLPSLANVGLSGSSGLDVERMIAAMIQWKASSVIMVPQMLQAVVSRAQAGTVIPDGLRYMAVGGAPVSAHLLREARALGLPVYEGYGLSECASVVAVNRPEEQREGSVGKPLPHLRLSFADDGEIRIHDVHWRGYLGQASAAKDERFIATGDLGHLDSDGYLYLTGRKKNMFITSFGRNVAPEWVESELVAHFPILQAAVFGEARPFNSAVIFPYPKATPEAVAATVAEVNQRLPDYARIRHWIKAREPFTPGNGLSTPNGRLRRPAILAQYAEQIDALYPH